MKLHSFFIETAIFSVVLIFFVLPPLFFTGAHDFSWRFPYTQMLYAFFAAGLLHRKGKFIVRSYTKMQFVRDSADMWTAFGVLCVTSALMQLIVFFAGDSPVRPQIFPETPTAFVFCLIGFACSAFFEEAIFRVFLPDGAKNIAARARSFTKGGTALSVPAPLSAAIEIVVALCFALSHRYLGIPGALNALAAHFFLRRCYVKTSALWTNTAAHFLYNVLQLVLLR